MTYTCLCGQLTISDDEYELNYWLEKESSGREYFNVGIAMRKKSDGSETTSIVKDVTSDEKTAQKLLKMLFDGLVTPVTLQYIVEDFIFSEYCCDECPVVERHISAVLYGSNRDIASECMI